MSNILLVPIHLDALVLHQKQVVVEAMADFTRLPYDDGRQDRNASVPYLSEEILSQPFQDRGLHLNAGVHLHWALPDALTKGYMDLGTKADRQSKAQDARMLLDAYSRPSTVTFPPVPNRWLVTRSRSGAVERQWVVESDYLFPPATIEPEQAPDAINYPFPDAQQHPDDPQQPFRYMGRKVTLDDWIESDETSPKPTYLTPLTAVGYGEPNFAAFYPNCHSVFGCYDDELSTYDALSDVAYDLLGWYSASNDDCLSGDSFCQAVKATRKMYLEETTDATSFAALADLFRWTVSTTEQEQDFPTRLICYARLTFAVDSQTDLQEEPWFTERSVKVAVGNTGTEALTAYLVHQLGDQITLPNEKAADGAPTNAQGAADGTDTASVQLTPEQNKRSLEDLWEALHLAPQLQGQRLDSGPRFSEARHEKGFSAVSAGMLWMIRPAPGGDAR